MHPDRLLSNIPAPEREMIESNYKRITDAWDTLKGEKSRATYDENLRVKKTKHRNGRQLVETAVIIGGTAIANGLIGIAAEELLSNHRNDATFISRGACRWEDRGWLICKGQCESEEWDAYKYHTGFLMDGSIGGYLTTDLPDKNFGGRCWIPWGYKAFCCKEDERDKTWAGRWISVMENVRARCSFYALPTQRILNVGRCGLISCIKNEERQMANITGDHCNQLFIYNMHGHAYPGYIQFEQQNITKNIWIKTA
uniref:J domain-containing protein n=1 Tax=Ditylenchus dipsaci TaxID=166011 RepID=A0A915E7C9_9BILA